VCRGLCTGVAIACDSVVTRSRADACSPNALERDMAVVRTLTERRCLLAPSQPDLDDNARMNFLGVPNVV